MKKLITLLVVMVAFAGVVFAADGTSKIVLSSSVAQVSPNFTLYLGSDAGTTAGYTVSIDEDISESDVEKTFYIQQTGTTAKPYAKYNGSVTLVVTIGPFTHTFTSGKNVGTFSTATYEIKSADKGNGYSVTTGEGANATVAKYLEIGLGSDGSSESAIDSSKHTATFKLTYSGNKVTDTNANKGDNKIAKIVAKWTHDDTLPMEGTGTAYTADVKLEFTYGN